MAKHSQCGAPCQKRTAKGHDLYKQDGPVDAFPHGSLFACDRRHSQQGHADSIRAHDTSAQDIDGPRRVADKQPGWKDGTLVPIALCDDISNAALTMVTYGYQPTAISTPRDVQ